MAYADALRTSTHTSNDIADLIEGVWGWGSTSGGSANAQTLTTAVAQSTGNGYRFIAGFTNTGATTLNINAAGAVSVIRSDGNALLAGDITAGNTYEVIYNGTSYVLVNPTPKWINWTPAATPNSGTISALTVSQAQYLARVDGTIEVNFQFTFNVTSGAPTQLSVTGLPIVSGLFCLVVGYGNVAGSTNKINGYQWSIGSATMLVLSDLIATTQWSGSNNLIFSKVAYAR